MKEISVQELAEALKNNGSIVLLDVREDFEYNIGHLPSVHIPMSMLPDRVKELNPEAHICVMCKSGNRAASVANFLQTNHQFKHISVVKGGIEAYVNEIDNSIEI